MGRKRRHHYVPRFYLEGFSDPNNFPSIWIYEKGNPEIRRQRAENIAFERDYYSFHLPSGEIDSETIENALAELESRAAPLLKKIETKVDLNEEEKRLFSNFLAYSMTRVPNYRRNMEDMSGKLIKNVMLRVTADQIGFERKLKKYEKVRGEKYRTFVEKYMDTAINEGFLKKEFSEFSLGMIDLAREFAAVFNAMNWSFLEASDEQGYLTSDNPVYYFDPTYRQGFDGVGLLNDNTEAYFPVSKNIMLMANWKNIKGYHRLQNFDIRAINRRTVIFAQKFVFASNRSTGISKLVDKYKDSHPKMVVAS
jgi:hypothetical protein